MEKQIMDERPACSQPIYEALFNTCPELHILFLLFF